MAHTFKSPLSEQDWRDYYQLRWQVLREPWHQVRGSERDELEDQAFHIMTVDENRNTIGVGRLHRISSTSVQIRYMAVLPRLQGIGIGSEILRRLEAEAVNWGCREVLLNARLDAADFYLHLGYQITGDAPMLFGCIAHKRMHKLLAQTLSLSQPIESD